MTVITKETAEMFAIMYAHYFSGQRTFKVFILYRENLHYKLGGLVRTSKKFSP